MIKWLRFGGETRRHNHWVISLNFIMERITVEMPVVLLAIFCVERRTFSWAFAHVIYNTQR